MNTEELVSCHIANWITHDDGNYVYCSWMEVHDDVYSHRENDSKYYKLKILYISNDCGIVHIKNNRLSLRRKLGDFIFKCTAEHCVVPLDIAKLMVKHQSFDIPEYHQFIDKLNGRYVYPQDQVKVICRFYKNAFGNPVFS